MAWDSWMLVTSTTLHGTRLLLVGMRNATDEEPPLDSRLNYDRGLYFMGHLGPVTYVTLSHNF